MSTTATKPCLTLKLLIDNKSNRVLFAEAEKDFVDFLFSLMSLPIGTVVRLLSAGDMVGSLGKVYQSLDNLSDAHILPGADKASLLAPKVAALGVAKLIALPSSSQAAKPMYHCEYMGNCSRFVAYDPSEKCPICSRTMSVEVTIVKSQAGVSGERGYVKDVVTYMVMDDLEVKPMSTISTIALINQYGIREIGDLQESVVSVGMDEGLKLLKASFESKTVLSNVFLGSVSDGDIPM